MISQRIILPRRELQEHITDIRIKPRRKSCVTFIQTNMNGRIVPLINSVRTTTSMPVNLTMVMTEEIVVTEADTMEDSVTVAIIITIEQATVRDNIKELAVTIT